MDILTLNPKDCCRWQYADRSSFEFGDISALAQDIQTNGQIEPVFVRASQRDGYKYEVIAGSRRWKACLEADLPLKAILHDVSDEQAALIQIKENQSLGICDYSKGLSYSKLLADNQTTQVKLAQSLSISRDKLQRFLSFAKVPQVIWDAVGNVSRVSSRTASTIEAIAKKGEGYISILIELAEDIRKGIGSRRLERLVDEALLGDTKSIDPDGTIMTPSGAVIGTLKNNQLKFAKGVLADQERFIKYLVKFF